MKWGYANGYAEARFQTIQEYERVLAILREELADARRLADSQSARADAAVDLLLGHLGARAISIEGQALDEQRAKRQLETVKTLTALPDNDDDLPWGHPNGRYNSAREASLFEDVSGVEG